MADPVTYEIQEKEVTPILVAGLRMHGKYSEVGLGFRQLGRHYGRVMNGKSMMLTYDEGYKTEGADFEACFPIKKRIEKDGFSVRELPGGRHLTLIHRGPYDTLSSSYDKLCAYAESKGYRMLTPSREIYLKGPGMIFKGNPQKYLTEIQMPVVVTT